MLLIAGIFFIGSLRAMGLEKEMLKLRLAQVQLYLKNRAHLPETEECFVGSKILKFSDLEKEKQLLEQDMQNIESGLKPSRPLDKTAIRYVDSNGRAFNLQELEDIAHNDPVSKLGSKIVDCTSWGLRALGHITMSLFAKCKCKKINPSSPKGLRRDQ